MKNRATIAHYALIVGSSIFFIAAGTQQEKQNKKEPQQKESKQRPEQERDGKADKVKNKHQSGTEGKDNGNGNNEYKRHDKEKGNEDNGKDDTNNGNDKNDGISKREMKDGYKWDRESFKERKKYRNSDKVTICHKFSRDNETPVTISVSANALKAHLGHGDAQGDCPVVKNDKSSDIFLRKRTDYYNTIENSNEQVIYSKSILDFAQERLEFSRRQLTLMQNNKIPPADIQRKQAAVVELEQNVSLLQTLIGVTADLVSNRLQ